LFPAGLAVVTSLLTIYLKSGFDLCRQQRARHFLNRL
jgi:hypothetical protein